MIKNNSGNLPNFSQRNNEFTMKVTGYLGTSVMKNIYMCNVTSMCMCATYNGYPEESMPKGKYSQVEDNFCDYMLHDDEVIKFYADKHPKEYKEWINGHKNAYWPNEWHDVLTFAFNKWMGNPIDTFQETYSIKSFINDLNNGLSLPTSMKFGELGHIIGVKGFKYTGDESIIRDYLSGKIDKLPDDFVFIYDDPYGKCIDFYNGTYSNVSGKDCEIKYKDFIATSKPTNKELVMCHVMKHA